MMILFVFPIVLLFYHIFSVFCVEKFFCLCKWPSKATFSMISIFNDSILLPGIMISESQILLYIIFTLKFPACIVSVIGLG